MKRQFGKNLRRIIRESGMTQAEVARRAEMSESHLGRILSGSIESPSFPTVEALAKVLSVSPGFLIDGGDVPTVSPRDETVRRFGLWMVDLPTEIREIVYRVGEAMKRADPGAASTQKTRGSSKRGRSGRK